LCHSPSQSQARPESEQTDGKNKGSESRPRPVLYSLKVAIEAVLITVLFLGFKLCDRHGGGLLITSEAWIVRASLLAFGLPRIVIPGFEWTRTPR
jgi:hypothetical protein